MDQRVLLFVFYGAVVIKVAARHRWGLPSTGALMARRAHPVAAAIKPAPHRVNRVTPITRRRSSCVAL